MPTRWSLVPLVAGVTAAVLVACANGGTPQQDHPAVSMEVVATRAAHTSTSLKDGRVFVAGGCVTDGCTVASVGTALVDADGLHASPGPDLSEPRTSHTATALSDGRVVIVGGFLGEGAGVSDAIEVFDPTTGELVRADRSRCPGEVTPRHSCRMATSSWSEGGSVRAATPTRLKYSIR